MVKRYGAVEAVNGLTFDVPAGRIVGLVGANGAGKTTAMKMLTGLLKPTRGQALLNGRDVLEPATRQDLGYLPEESPLYDDETPRSYLAFFARMYGLNRDDARVRSESLLDRLMCAPVHREKTIGTLSKGLKRKVAIARCLIHDPPALVLDEPTSGLDPLTADELDSLVQELRSEGKAVLLSAHNLRQVEELCDEIIVLNSGSVIARGTLSELRRRLGGQQYRIRASVRFDGSVPRGAVHEALFGAFDEVESAIAQVRTLGGEIIEVESVPPKLETLMRAPSATTPS